MAVAIYQYKEHMSILRKLSAEEIIDLFKNIPAVINRKYMHKLRGKASTSDISENVIDSFIFLLAESSYVNESEFRDNLKSIGFCNEQISAVCDCAFNKTPLYVNIFQNSRLPFLRFKDLEWRLESKISSRSALNEFSPCVCIKLTLDRGKNSVKKSNAVGEQNLDECSESKQLIMKLDLNRIRHIINVLEEALINMKVQN